MQTDRYTKVVLTIIAAALVGLFFQGSVMNANAQNSGVSKVTICSVDGAFCAPVTRLHSGGQLGVQTHNVN